MQVCSCRESTHYTCPKMCLVNEESLLKLKGSLQFTPTLPSYLFSASANQHIHMNKIITEFFGITRLKIHANGSNPLFHIMCRVTDFVNSL